MLARRNIFPQELILRNDLTATSDETLYVSEHRQQQTRGTVYKIDKIDAVRNISAHGESLQFRSFDEVLVEGDHSLLINDTVTG